MLSEFSARRIRIILFSLILCHSPICFALGEESSEFDPFEVQHCMASVENSLKTIDILSPFNSSGYMIDGPLLWRGVGGVVGAGIGVANGLVSGAKAYDARQRELQKKLERNALQLKPMLELTSAMEMNYNSARGQVDQFLRSEASQEMEQTRRGQRRRTSSRSPFATMSSDRLTTILEHYNRMRQQKLSEVEIRRRMRGLIRSSSQSSGNFNGADLDRFLQQPRVQSAIASLNNAEINRKGIKKWESDPLNRKAARSVRARTEGRSLDDGPSRRAQMKSRAVAHGFAGTIAGIVGTSLAQQILYKKECLVSSKVLELWFAPQYNVIRGCHFSEAALETLVSDQEARMQLCKADPYNVPAAMKKIIANDVKLRDRLPKVAGWEFQKCGSDGLQGKVLSQSGVTYHIDLKPKDGKLQAGIDMETQEGGPRLNIAGTTPHVLMEYDPDQSREKRFSNFAVRSRGLNTTLALTELTSDNLIGLYLNNEHPLSRLDPEVAGQAAAGEGLILANLVGQFVWKECSKKEPQSELDKLNNSDLIKSLQPIGH